MATNGILGESAVVHYLLKNGYEVFMPFNGTQQDYDMIAVKEDQFYRVSVKSTTVQSSSGKWITQIKRVRINSGKNNIHGFDNTKCDLLAVYIVPEDRVVLIDAKTIQSTSAINID